MGQRSGQKWTKEEDEQLVREMATVNTLESSWANRLGQIHGRDELAILYRIARFYRTDYYPFAKRCGTLRVTYKNIVERINAGDTESMLCDVFGISGGILSTILNRHSLRTLTQQEIGKSRWVEGGLGSYMFISDNVPKVCKCEHCCQRAEEQKRFSELLEYLKCIV